MSQFPQVLVRLEKDADAEKVSEGIKKICGVISSAFNEQAKRGPEILVTYSTGHKNVEEKIRALPGVKTVTPT